MGESDGWAAERFTVPLPLKSQIQVAVVSHAATGAGHEKDPVRPMQCALAEAGRRSLAGFHTCG